MQDYLVELSFIDAVRLDEAAKLSGRSVDSFLLEAAKEDRILYAALAPHTATLSAIPSHPAPHAGRYEANGHKIVAILPQYVESLSIARSVKLARWQATFEDGPLDWHYWNLDVPQVVGLDMVFVARASLNGGSQDKHAAPPVHVVVDRQQRSPADKVDWKEAVREIADELDAKDKAAEAWSGNSDMAGRVALIAIKRGITGPHGQLTASNILREALQGGRWVRKSRAQQKPVRLITRKTGKSGD